MFEQAKSDLEKALDLTQVTGQGLFQEKVSTVIQDVLDHNNPLRRNLPRLRGEGKAWELRQITAQTGHSQPFSLLNDTEEPDTEANIARTPKSFVWKIFLERGKVTQQGRDVGRSWRDLFADEMTAITTFIRDQEEDVTINGDAAVVGGRQFSGLKKLAPAAQTITVAGPLTLRRIDETIDTLISRPNMLVMSKRTRRELWSILQSNQRFVDSIEVTGGFRVTAYAPDIGIFYSQFIANNEGAGVNESRVYVLDTEFIHYGVLTDFRMIPLSRKSSQFEEFDIRGSETLVLANDTKGLAMMEEITPLP